MKLYWRLSREAELDQKINGIISSLTSGYYTDEEIATMEVRIRTRCKEYLKNRNKSIKDDLEKNKSALVILKS